MIWPLASVRSSVNTSPLACGSIRTVRTLGWVSPAKVDRAAFNFQVPKAGSAAQVTAASTMSGTVRMGTTMRQMGGKWQGQNG